MYGILAALLSTCTGVPDDSTAAAPSVPLTCARDVRLLTPDQAALGLPVRFESVITYVDAGNTVFVQDATAGTHVHDLPRDPGWRWGQRVLVEGKTFPGLYIPGIRAARVQPLGPGETPAPVRATIDDLASGVYHYQWVEIEGIGRAVAATAENTSVLRLAVGSRTLEVRLDEVPPEGKATDLVDARLRVRGLAAGVINNRRQLVSPYLKARSFRSVSVVDPAPDPARLPVVPVDNLLRYTPEGASERRVKVRGIVLSAPPGGPIFLREGGRAILIEPRTAEALRPGDVVEVLGFPQMGSYRAFLADATLTRTDTVSPPAAQAMTIPELLKGNHDADLVAVEGELVASYAGPDSVVLTMQETNTAFRVRSARGPAPEWPPGSRLAVRGICRVAGSPNRDYNFRPASFELWTDAPDGIRLLSAPSWWTHRRLMGALGMLVVATAAALVWIFLLRRRVREQTAFIRAQLAREVVLEERQRIAREVHDTLEQELVGLALRLDAAAAVADTRSLGLLDTTRRLVTRIQAEVRDLVWDLRERVGGPHDLGQSLGHLADHLQQAAPVPFRVLVRGAPWSLPGPVEHDLRRIVQEALTNALKHADPRSVEVEVSYAPDQLCVQVRDDGRGFDSGGAEGAKPGHFGLVGMRERARKINARLALVSTPGRGTTVEVQMPRPDANTTRNGDDDGEGGGRRPDHDPGDR
jgi:signal transduction histidine kinase